MSLDTYEDAKPLAGLRPAFKTVLGYGFTKRKMEEHPCSVAGTSLTVWDLNPTKTQTGT